MSVIFIDTNCELNYKTAYGLGLTNVIRMPYTICDQEYFYDLGENYDAHKFFTLEREGNMPITSGLNAENYKEYFEPFFKKGEDILYISFSSKLSGTFAYLDTAIAELTKKYPKAKFRRFDTKSISLGAGIAVYYAGKLYQAGKTNDEIIEELTTFITRTNTIFSPNDLFFLKRGGRISAAAATFATMLQIKPIIRVDDEGKLVNNAKVQGRNKAISYIAEDVITNARDLDKFPIIILDADCKADSEKLQKKIKEALPKADIWVYDVGPVIGTHCGYDTIGACYVGDKRNY